jgi:hypothetical protein
MRSDTPEDMGAHVSQLESVDLKDLPDYETLVSQTYTVQRNSKNPDDPIPGTRGAREDEGWIILREPLQSWIASHATFAKGSNGEMSWRFHMVNGLNLSDPEFLYGWRRIGTFWPTRLTTWEEREAWFAWLLAQVETLKTPLQKQEEAQAPISEELKAARAAEAEAKAKGVVWGRVPADPKNT